jgi:peptide/nickel transport system substrate-binding protein
MTRREERMDWNRSVRRRTLLKAMGAGMGAYLLAGCGSPSPTTKPAAHPTAGATQPTAGTAPAAKSTVERAVRLPAVRAQGLFEAPNPFGSRTGPGQQQTAYIFDSLLWRDSSVDPIPWLAERWVSNADGTEWTLTLRKGVRFHDGEPLTAEDIVFSYEYLPAHPTTYYGSIKDLVKEVKALDEGTIRMTLPQPFAPFLNSVIASTPILPKHTWSKVSDPRTFNDPKAYVGSGPYRLTSMSEADSAFQFVANDDFFLGKPYVRRLEFIPAADEMLALKSGHLDVVSPTAFTGLTDEVLAPFRRDPKYSIIEAPGEGVTALYFNLTKGEPYNNVLFRRAVFHAIDRRELIGRLLSGNAEEGSPGGLPSSNLFVTTDVEQYPYDTAKAKALLDQVGYLEKDRGRAMADGSPLSIPLLFASNQARVAEFVRAQLGQVGIRVEMRSSDPGTASQLQGEGSYEAAIVTHGGLGSDPDNHMFRIFNSPPTAKHWQKAWGYRNDEFDRLAKEQRRTLDKERRTSLLHQMQRVVSQDVPIIHLYYPNRFIIYRPDVFDAWYFTPLSNPLAMNKHFFVTGQKTGLTIRQDR